MTGNNTTTRIRPLDGCDVRGYTIKRDSSMLVGKNDQKYIMSDGDFRNRLITYYGMIIDYGERLQNGNFVHGMGMLRYYLMHNNTILYLRCDNEELFNKSNNMAKLGSDLYMGMYQGPEKIYKLKNIVKDCKDMKSIIELKE